MFYPKIGDHVLLRNGKVARIAQENVVFSIEVLPDLRPATCSKEFIVKIIPQVDLDTLKAGDTVELTNGETREIRSVAYSPFEKNVQVVFTTCKTSLPWVYNRNGTLPGFPMDSIVKIISKPKLDFSMNTVDLTTLKEGDTVHLSDRSTTEVVSIARKMLETIYVIRLRRLGLNHYCVDGYSLDKDKPSIVKIVPKPSATDKPTGRGLGAVITFARPKFSFSIDPAATRESLYDSLRKSTLFAGSTPLGISQFVDSLFNVDLTTLQPGTVVTLANGATKEVLEVDRKSRAHTNHICIKYADGTWIYNPDGTRPPGRDSAYNVVGVATAAMLAGIKADKKFFESIDVSAIKRGDRLTHANGKENIAGGVTARLAAGETYTVWHENGCPIVDVHVNGIALRTESHAWSIVKITPRPKPTLLTINSHVVKPGDRLRLRNGTVNTVKDVTWNEHDDNWTVAYGGEFAGSLRNFSYYSSGKNPFNSEFDIAAVVNEPTPLTIGGHIVKSGDVLTRANGDRIVVNKITPEPRGKWKVWHSAYGGCFFEVNSSGCCHLSPDLTIAAVVPNQTVPQGQPGTRMTLERLTQLVEQRPSAFTEIAQLTGRSVTDLLSDLEKGLSVPWPKPITTPPTKKDADPIGQVAVLDKDGDWMQEEWWAARDMLAEGKITGWAHTQVWHDAKNKLSDPWN